MGISRRPTSKSPHFKQMLFFLITGYFFEFTLFLLLGRLWQTWLGDILPHGSIQRVFFASPCGVSKSHMSSTGFWAGCFCMLTLLSTQVALSPTVCEMLRWFLPLTLLKSPSLSVLCQYRSWPVLWATDLEGEGPKRFFQLGNQSHSHLFAPISPLWDFF